MKRVSIQPKTTTKLGREHVELEHQIVNEIPEFSSKEAPKTQKDKYLFFLNFSYIFLALYPASHADWGTVDDGTVQTISPECLLDSWMTFTASKIWKKALKFHLYSEQTYASQSLSITISRQRHRMSHNSPNLTKYRGFLDFPSNKNKLSISGTMQLILLLKQSKFVAETWVSPPTCSFSFKWVQIIQEHGLVVIQQRDGSLQ